LASINLNIKSSIDSIARVGMHDSHAGNTGGRTAWSEGGEVFSSGRDTEPASGRINFEIYRLGNTYNFYYGGISILTGTGTSLANSIVLTNTRFQTHVGKTAKYHLIRVREYVSPEPNFAIAGAEETLIYHTSGTFISSNIDTGQESAFLNLDFNITEPANTNIQFRLRSAIDEAGLSTATWYGPTGTGDYYTTTGTAINPIHNGHRWVQYKAFFLTTDTLVTPNLSDITTHFTLFNQRPDTPTNVEPASGVNGQNLNLILTGSTYLDFESNPHINTEWRVDNDVNFLTPVWTRTAGVAETTTTVNDTIGTFANELNLKTELDHNTVYYWQVRYHDGTVWSDWSTATNFTTNIFHTPSNQLPVDMATGINLNAELSTSLFQNEQPGHTHLNTK
ncbi:MAG: hypothetical protein LRZ98_02150, partial [Candidatus Pacebacteria bacterium]|nr:hypothetical protein [Candidatus Paceibacterota bacterium]